MKIKGPFLSNLLRTFSQDELKKFAARVLSFIKNPEQGIGTELFDAIIKITPQTTVEALIVDNIEKPSRILLTWRNDRYYLGWHFPGSYIRFGKNFDETVQNLVEKELGTGVKKLKDSGIKYSIIDNRGHTLGIIFLVELDGSPNTGQWFNQVPSDLLYHHKKFLKRAIGWE